MVATSARAGRCRLEQSLADSVRKQHGYARGPVRVGAAQRLRIVGMGLLVAVAVLMSACGSSHSTAKAAPGAPAPASITPSATTGAASPAATTATIYLAQDGGQRSGAAIRPKNASLTGDGTLYVNSMTWQSWTDTSALGTGTGALDDCSPSCAGGTVTHEPAQLRLDRPVTACGTRYYSRAVVTWTGTVPRGADRVMDLDTINPAKDGDPCG